MKQPDGKRRLPEGNAGEDLLRHLRSGTIRAMQDKFTRSDKFIVSAKPFAVILALLLLVCPVDAAQKASAKTSRASGMKPYITVANQAVAALMKNDIAAFKKLLSVKLLERLGFAATEAKLHEEVLPFFSSYIPTSESEKITPTQDIFGNTGFAFYRVAVDKSGARKPYFVQVVKERGRLVIANLFVNKGYDDLNISR